MGALSLIVVACAPLLLVSLLNQHEVKAIEILFSDSVPASSPPSGGDDNGGGAEKDVVARNKALITRFSADASHNDMLVVVCENLQGLASECRSVRRMKFGNSWLWPSSSNNHFNNYNNNNNINNNNSFNDPWNIGSSSNTHNPTTVICPSQQNQSMLYQLNPDSSAYPGNDIASELVNSPLRTCLVEEVVLETDPPSLIVEDVRRTSNLTCPYTQLRLWQYQSQRVSSSSCWILQNFQENVLYRVCGEKFCRNCKDKQSTGFVYGSNSNNVKMCITDYTIVSVWSYCPGESRGSRLVRDRIIIPASCGCQSVPCEPVPWKK